MLLAEMTSTDFEFRIVYQHDDGRLVREQRLKAADFCCAVRHTLFDAFRLGLLDEYRPLANGARIEPLFPADSGTSPGASGFLVTVPLASGGLHACRFDLTYFGSSANRLRSELLRTKAMTAEQNLYYRLAAYLDDESRPQLTGTPAISLEPVDDAVPIECGRRRDLGPSQAWDNPDAGDLPVVIDAGILEETVEEARANPEREVAGFLLGRVVRDEKPGEVFLSVTGLASSGDTTKASKASVTYTPASFAQVKNIIRLRQQGEMVCGWYHSHPFRFCAECPLPTPPECIAKVLFYSQDDVHLMETTFDQPFMVGLLVALEPRIEPAIGHLPVKLYGWCSGEIKARGFEVVGSSGN